MRFSWEMRPGVEFVTTPQDPFLVIRKSHLSEWVMRDSLNEARRLLASIVVRVEGSDGKVVSEQRHQLSQ